MIGAGPLISLQRSFPKSIYLPSSATNGRREWRTRGYIHHLRASADLKCHQGLAFLKLARIVLHIMA
jgi:hypothetical protein